MNTKRIQTKEIQNFEIEHIAKVREFAPECMVLLKNEGMLPLVNTKRLALYGSGARRTIKGGGGSGDVNVRHFVTVEEGLENAGFEITTKCWLDAYDNAVETAKKEYFGELRRQADELGIAPMMYAMGKVAPDPVYQFPLDGEGNTAIYVLARNSGEGADRLVAEGDIKLTETEIRDILTLNKQYEKFVLVLNTGGMVDLAPVRNVKAILLMGQLGTPTGDALADVLTGKSYPSGKLTMTWAPIEVYSSTEGFGGINDTDYHEGVYVGYRYFDTAGIAPTFPFGFGMGYTSFELETKELTVNKNAVCVKVSVRNAGKAKGKEVVQIYTSSPAGKLDKPWQELRAYAKTKELAPGETEEITVSFPAEQMASYDEGKAAWVLEAGDYRIRVGSSSRHTILAGIVRLDNVIITEQVQNVLADCGFADWKSIPNNQYAAESDVSVVTLSAADVATRLVEYQGEPVELYNAEPCTWDDVRIGRKTLNEFVAGLTVEQLAYCCIGYHTDSNDIMEIIGNAAKSVAGGAGETTDRLKDLGVPVITMADGPAGLRLCQEYTFKNGEVKGGSSAGGDLLLVFTEEERQAMLAAGPEEDDQGLKCYQYCVALPIGTCVAQSFNDRMAEECGELVGAEMEMFGVNSWLAPALNIHRSPLCGRNFEYYSEDPYLSGCMAGYMTRGVQKYVGRGTTIKHFACNNQETNRFFTNSNVSERAAREIYLRGYEICIKLAQPHFVMTSYNLLNGEHTCNQYGLLTEVLRDEWGFEGVVMTDWLVTGGMGPKGEKWPCASAAGNIKAGNDLTMPGMPSDKADILLALQDQTHPYALSKAQLQTCAKRVLGMILKLTEEKASM